MKAGFPSRPLNTGTSAPQETPYQRAQGEWDARIGTARQQAKSWRLMAFGCLGIAFVFAIGFVIEATRSDVVPIIVPVNDVGKPGQIQMANQVYQPNQAEISYFLAHFVQEMFSKPVDPIVMKENVDDAFSTLVGHAFVTVSDWAQQTNPTADMGHQARTEEINTVLQRSPNTYQVDWTEKVYEDGALTATTQYTGLFQIVIHQPTNQAELLRNPLGLYISEISWSREA